MTNRLNIKTGILSGSFNPIHTGHLILANYLCEYEALDEVWFMVSPHNPLKEAAGLIADIHRVNMVQLAIGENSKFKCDETELSMPRPSYTIHTLDKLRAAHPQRDFHLIIGADNWSVFDQWKSYQRIINEYKLLIYPRAGFPLPDSPNDQPQNIKITPAPLIEISSTFIREAIAQGRNMGYFLPASVYQYIQQHNLYGHKLL